jgi:hypothetical protein
MQSKLKKMLNKQTEIKYNQVRVAQVHPVAQAALVEQDNENPPISINPINHSN